MPTGFPSCWLVLVLAPLWSAGQSVAPARRLSGRLDVLAGLSLHNSLRTHADERPESLTVYNATLTGQRSYQLGLAPSLTVTGRRWRMTLELPVTYETTHTYRGSRVLTESSSQTWPDGVRTYSTAALRADYAAVRLGARLVALPTRRFRPFVGGQLGHTWALRIRENSFSRDSPYGSYQGRFLDGTKGTNGLGHLTAAALLGAEVGTSEGPVLSVAVRAETGFRFQLFDSVDPVWRAVTVTVGYSIVRWKGAGS